MQNAALRGAVSGRAPTGGEVAPSRRGVKEKPAPSRRGAGGQGWFEMRLMEDAEDQGGVRFSYCSE